jgi:diguanylate cyclase (GGDEF)-like protein
VSPAVAQSGAITTAEALLWQGRFRRAFALLAGGGTIVLKWSGVLATKSLLARTIGERPALIVCAGLVLAYVALNQLMMRFVQRRGLAGRNTVATAVAAEIVLIFSAVYAVTPPEEYTRALIVSVFSVQFTQFYLGQRATFFSLACVSFFFTVLVSAAYAAGAIATPAEQLWDLALYVIGVLIFVAMQGHLSVRLKRIIHVFERAQEGDFSQRYDESLDRMPDAITVVGRAYNRLCGHLETIVLTDPLSGCFNRRGFEQLTTREVSRAVRGSRPIAVLALDADHFKRINDELGHLTGDEVLREIGALLRETARMGDVVARIGGEEFQILAPDTDAAGAQILAARIQHAFHVRSFASLGGSKGKLTISIGVAADVARNAQVATALVARADEALYVAKRNGRDRSELWHPAMRTFDGAPPARRSDEVPEPEMVAEA